MSSLFETEVLDSSEKEEVVYFKAKIKSCAVCLFAIEITDASGDFVGYDCSISDNKLRMNQEHWKIPGSCPLKKKQYCIKLETMKDK